MVRLWRLIRGAVAMLVIALLVVPVAQGAPSKREPKPFAGCGDLVRYARAKALRVLGPYDLPVPGPYALPPAATDGGGVRTDAGAPIPGTAADDFSGTNVQEEGVDEPDSVKTDGRTMFVATGDGIRSVDVSGGAPRALDVLALDGYSDQLLLRGQKLLAISGPGEQAGPDVRTIIREIDVSDPTGMRVTRIMQVQGDFVGARLTGGTARIVVTSSPHVDYPAIDLPPQSTAQANALVRRAVRRTRLRGWRPSYKLVDRQAGVRRWRPLVPCRSVRRTHDFSGLGVLTVLTIDVDRGLPAVDSDALYTSADTVYASHDNLYLATQRWVDPSLSAGDLPSGSVTTIHKLSTNVPDQTVYRATGEAPGYLLSQWSLSEHDGVLRVATTDEPTWIEPTDRTSESFVTVLGEQDGALVPVGRVRGLGRGESIFAVRFIGDRGFVVTFRQTDPLYTLDLSDPANPRVVGELKLLGYSAYLHPVGDHLLLGVGQDADDRGSLRGTQVSLFDVSNLAQPRRLAQQTLAEGSWSEVEWDHHAFLYWPPTGTAVIPATLFSERQDSALVAAFGFSVDPAGGLAPIGRVEHRAGGEQGYVSRSVVVGDRLYTVSDLGVKASSLASFAEIGFLRFAGPDPPPRR